LLFFLSKSREENGKKLDIFQEIVRAKNKGESAVLATVVDSKGSAPRTAGARMLIKKDGTILGSIGGGAIEKTVVDEAMKIAGTVQTKLLAYDLGKDLSMSCGGRMTIFLESLIPPSQLIIFGAGHIGTALAQLGKLLDFHVIVIDNRSEFANTERLPFADEVIVGNYGDILPELSFHQQSFIVLVTHRHVHDQEILEYCIQHPFKYLGMIGSKTKVAKTFQQLHDKGVKDEKIHRVHSPIGLDIGADTPAEIAVAIVAEIIAVKTNTNAAFSKLPGNNK